MVYVCNIMQITNFGKYNMHTINYNNRLLLYINYKLWSTKKSIIL